MQYTKMIHYGFHKNDSELIEDSTIRNFRIVQKEGNKELEDMLLKMN